MKTNPEIDQDRVFDTVDHFDRFGYVMFHQQVTIYKNISRHVLDVSVLEAGCGSGLGAALLERNACSVLATDKLKRNVDFAENLYPWLDFQVWDINQPAESQMNRSVVVCVEAIEHVENPEWAIQNLIAAATEEVWISTPNGISKKRPPDNPHHVCEYTTGEMLDMINRPTKILHWKDLSPLPVQTKVSPLVYRIQV